MTQTLTTPTTQTAATTLTQRRQRTVARLLGAQSFATIHWQHLLQEGTLVELHIGRCGFTTRLALEEMGIRIENEAVRETLARWTTLGEKRLLPDSYLKQLARIENRARATLKDHAFHTELGWFVPVTAYETWRGQTEALREAYTALRDDIIARYDELVRQVLSEYEVIAADTYQRLRSSHPEAVREGEQHFVATYCNRIAHQIPSREKIHASFFFRFFRVPGTQPLGGAPEHPQALSDAPAPESMGVGEMRVEMEQRLRQQALLEQDLRHDAQQRVRVMVDEWLTTIVAHLRTLVYDAATDVLTTLKRRGGAHFPHVPPCN